MADLSFCDVPIIIRDDFPVGCAVMVSGDGRQVIPIVNLDIETRSTLTPRPDLHIPESGSISGTLTAYFESKELYESFVTGWKSVGRLAMESIVRLGDQYARTGQLNRTGRKQWRKDRKRLVTNMRREDARLWRENYGARTF